LRLARAEVQVGVEVGVEVEVEAGAEAEVLEEPKSPLLPLASSLSLPPLVPEVASLRFGTCYCV
jgi:hypothetical protein